MKNIRLGLTFDDVLLIPQKFKGNSRSEIDVSTKFSRRIPLQIPIVSSNMDTVTESKMAIILARAGGIGIIHRFMSIEDQRKQIEKVKRAESIIIENPYTLRPEATVEDAFNLMETRFVSGILITDPEGILEGILTKRDLRFETDITQKVSSLMSPKNQMVIASNDITMNEAKSVLKERKVEKLPLIDKFGKLTGLITSVDIEKSQETPDATKDNKGRLRVGAAIGVKQDFLTRANTLLEAEVDALVVDIAHGHSDLAINTVKKLRKEFGDDIEVVAGNVATAEGTTALISAGADGIKAGVGPGSICITRIVTGSGVPQITALMDCTTVTKENGIPIISDGGIRNSGDLTKAIAAGASTVMIGNLLAGTNESPGFPILRNGRQYKVIRGMASLGASLGRESRENPYVRGKKGSFDDEEDFSSIVPEGVEAFVAVKGSAKDVLIQLVGGLQSGISYCGSISLVEMQKKAQFIRITGAGIQESKAHDVDVA
ncbi:MAG: IMP dehydrogenase [Candidatus Hodarchaeales archaeon]